MSRNSSIMFTLLMAHSFTKDGLPGSAGVAELRRLGKDLVMRTPMRKTLQLAVISFVLLTWCGCGGEFHEPWREQKLSSGKSVKVKSLQIAWGVEHDEPRSPEKDCFVLQFVYVALEGGDDAHVREAREVFELIRPVSEQWGFTNAELMAYSTLEPDRHYDLFLFQRGSDGKWSSKLERH